MRHYVLGLCAFFFAIAMWSCSNKEAVIQEDSIQETLLGKWQLKVTGFTDETVPKDVQDYLMASSAGIKYEFKKDSTYLVISEALNQPKLGSYSFIDSTSNVVLEIPGQDPKIMEIVRSSGDTLFCESYLTATGKMIYYITRLPNE
ncbi:MAG: hypothetical protein HRT74_11270 [Flavobacteriales bacterium]|nr:hypothetical protein [Flavobacteriales bacterium]